MEKYILAKSQRGVDVILAHGKYIFNFRFDLKSGKRKFICSEYFTNHKCKCEIIYDPIDKTFEDENSEDHTHSSYPDKGNIKFSR